MALHQKVSDHCPIVLKDIEMEFGPKPFQLFDIWLEEMDIEQVVKNAWKKSTRSRRPNCIF